MQLKHLVLETPPPSVVMIYMFACSNTPDLHEKIKIQHDDKVNILIRRVGEASDACIIQT